MEDSYKESLRNGGGELKDIFAQGSLWHKAGPGS